MSQEFERDLEGECESCEVVDCLNPVDAYGKRLTTRRMAKLAKGYFSWICDECENELKADPPTEEEFETLVSQFQEMMQRKRQASASKKKKKKKSKQWVPTREGGYEVVNFVRRLIEAFSLLNIQPGTTQGEIDRAEEEIYDTAWTIFTALTGETPGSMRRDILERYASKDML